MCRRDLALVFCACFVAFPAPIARAEGNSWVGKKIMPKEANLDLRTVDMNDQWKVVGTLENAIVTVEKDDGHWIKVRSNHISGWIDKKDAVLLEDALEYFSHRIQLNDKDSAAYNSLAIAWSEKGEYDLAIKNYSGAIRLNPKDGGLVSNRGNAWAAKKEYDRAINDYDVAIRLDPNCAAAFISRGIAWNAKKDYERALKDCDEAIRLDAKLVPAYTCRAWWLATCPDGKYRDGKKAVESALKACELSNWKDPTILGNLAAAYAESGDFTNAVKWQKKAFELPSYETEYKQTAELGRKLLKLYEEKKAYRRD
jgi:tetratricopeptide (TPR) repeat protein